MTQTPTYSHDNQSGAAYRAAVNLSQQAAQTGNSGPSPPAETYPFMPWNDTSGSPLLVKQRDEANSTWITIAEIDGSGLRPYYNGTVIGPIVTRTVGTAANNVVALDASSKLPAVDGSQLTGLSTIGRWALVDVAVASGTGASLGIVFDTSAYVDYVLILDRLVPFNNDSNLRLRASTNSGATFLNGASDYEYALSGVTPGNEFSETNAGQSYIALNDPAGNYGISGSSNDSGYAGRLWFSSPGVNAKTRFRIEGEYTRGAGTITSIFGAAQVRVTARVNALIVFIDSGNLRAGGSVRLYGIEQ